MSLLLFYSGRYPAPGRNIVGNNGILDSDVTFTRASTAYAFVNGVLTSFAIDVPRFGSLDNGSYNGLVIEGAATNLTTYSATLSDASWLKTAATAVEDAPAPTGEATAASTITTTNGTHAFRHQITVTASTAYVFSFYAKRGTMTDVKYSVFNNTGGADIVAATSYYSSINSSTFVRISVAFTTPVGCISINCHVARDSGTTGTVIVWGAQVETGTFATSYIATTSAAATRAADVCSITSLSTKSWFNALQGTIVSECQVQGLSTTYQTAYGISDGTVTNGVYLRVRGDNSQLEVAVIDTTTQAALTLANPAVVNTAYKVASAYQVNSFAAVVNNGTVQTDSSGTVPASLPTFYIGDAGAGNRNFNGTIKSLTYYPARLPDATLQSSTA